MNPSQQSDSASDGGASRGSGEQGAGSQAKPRWGNFVASAITGAIMGFSLGLIVGFGKALLKPPAGSGNGNLLPYGVYGAGAMFVAAPILLWLASSGPRGRMIAKIIYRLIVGLFAAFFAIFIFLKLTTR